MLQVSKKTLNIRGKLLDLSLPAVMGILNITPDSFYEGSRMRSEDELLSKAGQMLAEGATMIDVGGYSTRPGAREVGEAEESERVESAVVPLNKNFPELIISVDTFRSQVAKRAIETGAHIVNDVSGGSLDDQMFEVVSNLRVPYVLMHMRGTPQTMNSMTAYNQLVPDILKDLKEKIDRLRALGVADIIMDPGFGFAKNTEQNFELMQQLPEFSLLDCPLLVGISRKATIYKTLGILAGEALNGTSVMNTMALERGASIIRVHDVRPAMEAVKLWRAASSVN
ncbi:dihydropteroate synthase [Dyadobacter fanqingshengii]|uniref:dihydropteroate synthase n=1 Tax=Dyadobacter fanqingshengii TaxID=2906443 RepID=A0A9X1PDR5_9BACT|nr:dihydropteroate synthase [Dyadobacter fanqingshengii]MCF0041805.1 dihydropteroate synthase [Dyadobacter fanqingshengii]USJ36484.1 dihydropteroate synthase [Dyadobacter fanqingshengii]